MEVPNEKMKVLADLHGPTLMNILHAPCTNKALKGPQGPRLAFGTD
jgi:hypothetical protein